jgi:hypothetical protein
LLTYLTSVENSGRITRPPIANLIVNAFLRSPAIQNLFRLLTRLCCRSLSNAIACHEGKLDLFLLDLIVNGHMPCLTEGLSLFESIASMTSSAAVVHRYVSLLCPVQTRFLPDSITDYVHTLSSIAARRPSLPRVFFPIDSRSPRLHILNLNLSLFSSEFTIELHLLFDEFRSDGRSNVATFCDALETPIIALTFETDSFYLNSISIPLPVDPLRLTLVTMAYKKEVVTLTVAQRRTAIPIVISEVLRPLSLIIGGADPAVERSSIVLESFSFSTSDMERIVVDNFQLNELLQGQQKKNARIILEGTDPPKILPLPDVILQYFKAELFIPLFAEIDFQLFLGHEHIHVRYPESLISFFRNLLYFDPDSQLMFAQSNGFKLIAFLLGECSLRFLTFTLYVHFVDWFGQMAVLSVQESLFEEILLNKSLWVRATPSILTQIVTHWSEILIPLNLEMATKLLPVHRFVEDFSLFFGNYPDATPDQKDLIRSPLKRILLLVATRQFDQADLDAILILCVTSTDVEFVVALLSFLQDFVQNNTSPLQQSFEGCLMQLSGLVESNSPTVIIAVIEAFLALHATKTLNQSDLFDHIGVLCWSLNTRVMSVALVEQLLLRSSTNPAFLFIPLFISTVCGGDVLDQLLLRLETLDCSSLPAIWILWPLIIAVRYQHTTVMMFDFIILSARAGWCKLFYALAVIALAMGQDPIPLQRQLLARISQFYVQHQLPRTELTNFIEVALSFIFRRAKGSHSPCLRQLYRSSPFYSGDFVDPPPFSTPLVLKSGFPKSELSTFFGRVRGVTYPRMPFGIELTESRDWVDCDLADCSCLLIVEQKLTEYAGLAHLITQRNWWKLGHIYSSWFESTDPDTIFLQQMANSIASHKERIDRAMSSLPESGDIFICKAYETVEYINRRAASRCSQARKQWQQLWRRLTMDQSPWWKALPHGDIHYQRDGALLHDFCPARMKEYRQFDDHKTASLSRDIGSKQHVQKRIEELHAEEQKKSRDRAPPELLGVQDDLPDPERLFESSVGLGSLMNQEASLFRITGHIDCHFSLSSKSAHIVVSNRKVKTIQASSVAYILLRSYLHRHNGIEIITKLGKSYFVRFNWVNVLPLLHRITGMPSWNHACIQTVPYLQFVADRQVTIDWIHGRLSNFQYLMRLNIFGGRSFSEPSLYPFMPWILRDYSSKQIDLTNPAIYRTLSLPIGALNPARLELLLSHLKDSGLFITKPFLYNTCYVSPLCVYLWMIRVEPFTTLHINLQSGKFDHAARIFNSIGNAYRMASSQSNDYRELIPEFFFTSTFLQNENNFDLGFVDDVSAGEVILPPWSQAAMDFIYVHRKALESDFVTNNLPNWIDLIWGFKQTGIESINSHNTYDPFLYENVWEYAQANKLRSTVEAMLQHCGSMPPRLFLDSHPHRSSANPAVALWSVYNVPFETAAQFAVISRVSPTEFHLHCLSVSGAFFQISVFLPDRLSTVAQIGNRCSLLFETEGALVKNGEHFTLFAVTTSGRFAEFHPNKGNHRFIGGHIGRVSCMAAGGDWIATGGTDTTINIWNIAAVKPVHSITTCRDEAVSCAVGHTFGIVAGAMRDGSIFLIVIGNGATARVFRVSETPIAVIVTPGWGFVLVHSTKVIDAALHFYLVLFSVNGELIRKAEIGFRIQCWTAWESRKGFDFVAVVSAGGDLFAFEAFFLEIPPSFGKADGRVVAMEYFANEELLFVVAGKQLAVYSAVQMKLDQREKFVFGHAKPGAEEAGHSCEPVIAGLPV